MMSPLVECVPNISEGRDLEKIDKIVNSVRQIDGCTVLGVEPDHDYNRTVITFAGAPEPVLEGAVALILKSIELLDMREHKGEHPRLGVVDVCPFIPLNDMTMDQAADLARAAVDKVANVAHVPLFLYGAAASHKDRYLLSTLRKGEYEGLEARLTGDESTHQKTTRMPDAGTSEWTEVVSKSGGITIGARSILVAYNVNIGESDASVAKKIGSIVRSSGRLLKSDAGVRIRTSGMLPMVQGMGVPLEELGISQVSMNLRDVEQCPLHLAFMACKSIASDHGVEVVGSEIVGLVPLSAVLQTGAFFSPQETDEEKLVQAAVQGLGLNEHHDFDPKTGIIEWALAAEVVQ